MKQQARLTGFGGYSVAGMGQTQLSKTDSRIYGLDALKILSMVYVVILHSVGMGGVIFASKGSASHILIMVLFLWTQCAVNIFALVTGYVSYTDKPKKLNRKRIFDMWFQVVFYGLVITSICFFLFPGKITSKDFLCSAVPLFSNEYWYYTAYFIVYLMSPFINAAVRSLPEVTLRKTVITVIIVFSFFSIFANSLGIVQPFSFTWVFVLYFLGAAIRKCRIGEKISNLKLICCIVVCVFLSLCWYMVMKETSFLNSTWDEELLSKYISPTMLISAICHLLIFRRIRTLKGLDKVLRFMSPCVFATYLINAHPIVYLNVMYDAFVPLTNLNVFLTVLFILLFAVVFVICSCLIDKLRQILFKVIRLDKFSGLLAKLSDKIVDTVSSRF